MKPLVSIIIPTYNRAHLIGETLKSVLSQTYQNWECIVVDDGSTDYTDELMEFYCKKDDRIKYHHRPTNRPKGANTCRNYGFELSKGEFIQWLDSDDLILENKIQNQIFLINKKRYALVFCSWVTYKDYVERIIKSYNNNKEVYDIYDFFQNLHFFGGFLPSHTYLTSKNIIKKSGLWNEYLVINQDGEFFNRILLNIDKIGYSPGWVVYRMDQDNSKVSNYNSIIKVKDLIYSWRLIENYHEIRFKNRKESIYLKKSKDYLFKVINHSNPKLVQENSDFFSSQLKKSRKKKSFLYKLKRKLINLKTKFE